MTTASNDQPDQPPAKTRPRKKRTTFRKTRYLDHERVVAILAAKTSGATAAAKKLGIPLRTITAWVSGWRAPQAAEM